MKGKNVVHSSESDEWQTPAWLYAWLDSQYKFGLDAAASDENKLCRNWFTEEDNALKLSWKGYGNVFVNPPYSQNQAFIEKIIDEVDGSFNVLALVPSRTCTRWWHDYVMTSASEIWFIKGRLKFSGAKNCAPFPSCVIRFQYSPMHYDIWEPPLIYSLEQPKNVRLKSARRADNERSCSSPTE